MDLCCVCNKNERTLIYKGLCSLECQIRFITLPDGDCLIQRMPFLIAATKIPAHLVHRKLYQILKHHQVRFDETIVFSCNKKKCLNINHMQLYKISEYKKIKYIENRAHINEMARQRRKEKKAWELKHKKMNKLREERGIFVEKVLNDERLKNIIKEAAKIENLSDEKMKEIFKRLTYEYKELCDSEKVYSGTYDKK